MNTIQDITNNVAKGLAVRVDQKIKVCIKPKPRFLTEKMWLKLASKFIYIEKTEPRFSFGDELKDKESV